MLTPDLIKAYRWRRQIDREAGRRARGCLMEARKDVADHKARYPSSPLPGGRLDAPPAFHAVRYVENAEAAGFRVVGFADEIARKHHARSIYHEGWFTNEFQDSTYRGAALQLPGRKGAVRFVAAYQESDNGGYVVDLSEVFSELADDTWRTTDTADYLAAWEAARRGDRNAEIAAEEAREYDEAWQAGSRWTALGEEVKEYRRAALALIHDAKAGRGHDIPESIRSAVCGALRRFLDGIEKARAERATLKGDPGAWFFAKGLHLAFNEGAGETVFKA